MSPPAPNDPSPLEERFADLLAARDEALAAGSADPGAGEEPPPELRGRLERGTAWVKVLRRALSPERPAASTVRSGGGRGSQPATLGGDVPASLGRFEVLRPLGQGAHGVVWLAYDPRLGREVALKVPRASALASPELRRRFLREARAAAALDHPHIVAVFEAGEEGPFCYIASAYCPGPNLAAWLRGRDGPVPPRDAAALVAALAGAVQHAHERGVVHRDIKPSNILLGADGPAALAGGPEAALAAAKITDFGLAKLDGPGDATGTQTGVVIGTPAYMAPEQAAGRPGDVGPAADVYALGVVLYELLAGRAPFEGESAIDVLDQVRGRDPVPPGLLRPRLPAGLEAVCLKCLEKDPGRRYGSARALADDLERFLAGAPVAARPPGRLARARRWGRRHPAAAALAGAAAALLVAVAAGSSVAALRLRESRDAALAELGQAREGERDALDRLGQAKQAEVAAHHRVRQSYLDQARAVRSSGRLGRRAQALDVLKDAARIGPSAELRDEAVACLGLVDLKLAHRWGRDAPAGAGASACDPEFERYATSDDRGNVTARRVADDRLIARLPGAGNPVEFLRFSPDGRYLAVRYAGTRQGLVWDLNQDRAIVEVQGGLGVDFSPDGRRLAVEWADGELAFHGVGVGEKLSGLNVGKGKHVLAYRPGGNELAVGGTQTRDVDLYDVKSWKRRTLSHLDGVGAVAWCPDGRLLAVASGRSVYVWDAPSGEQRLVLDGVKGAADVFFSRDGRLLGLTGSDGALKVWDVETGRELLNQPDPGFRAWPQFGPGDRSLGGLGRDGTFQVWELAAGRECVVFHCRGKNYAGPWGIQLGVGGRLLAAAGSDGVRFWDLATMRQVAGAPPARGQLGLLHAGGGWLLTWADPALQCSTLGWGKDPGLLQVGPLRRLLDVAPGGGNWYAALTPDGRRAAVGDRARGKVFVVDLLRKEKPRELAGHPNLAQVAVSADTRWVAAGTWLNTPRNVVRVSDVKSGEVVGELPGIRAAFSPDGKWLVTAGEQGCRFCRVESWRPDWADGKPCTHIAIAPDGGLVALAAGPAVRLLKGSKAEYIATLDSPEGRTVNELAFSPDGGRLAAASDGQAVVTWDLRLIRRGLADVGLDWDLPAYAPAPALTSGPVLVNFLTDSEEPPAGGGPAPAR
jgi:WD40 repeat protein